MTAKTCFFIISFLVLVHLTENGHQGIGNGPMNSQVPLSEPNTLTYVGHATVLLRLSGTTFLTDPLYSERVAFYRRRVAPGVSLADLPAVDAILISHNHWDHLNKDTLRRLDRGIVVIVPDGLQKTIRSLGFQDVRGLKQWESTAVRGAGIMAVPARHFGTHCGYLIRKEKTVYFAGDTGLFEEMRTIGQRYRIDLALLPIGGYRPHAWFVPGSTRAMRRMHMAPDDLPAAVEMLGPEVVVPIHWGTFKLTGEPLGEPLNRLKQIVNNHSLHGKVRIALHGETIAF